jgi:LuxR family transcriptional regulator, quorum-sensing system regulator SolR
MPNWREEYIDRLTGSVNSEGQVFEQLAEITRQMGFEYCSFGVRAPLIGSAPQEFWWTTYPERWQSHYLGHNYLTIDPVIDATLHSPVPVVWNDQLFVNQPSFWEEARAHGVCHGWTLAVHGRHGELGLISLARSAGALSSDELAECEARLVWLAHAANGVVENLIAQKNSPTVMPVLTQREREVLRWTALGKTSDEIGVILGISARTVNFHITMVLDKLEAVNKTQAVAKAVILDLLY